MQLEKNLPGRVASRTGQINELTALKVARSCGFFKSEHSPSPAMEMVINMDASPSPADRDGDRRCHQEDHSRDAVAFLKRFHPATPWMLVTIEPSGKIGPAATFDPKRDEANGLKFIEENNGSGISTSQSTA